MHQKWMRQATIASPRDIDKKKEKEEEGKYKWSSKHMCINPPKKWTEKTL